MQTLHAFRSTVSCHKGEPITVDGQYFETEHVYTEDGKRRIIVSASREDKPNSHWRRAHFLFEGQRFEIFPGVFVTYEDAAKRSKVKLRVEAAEGVAIWKGYPRHRLERAMRDSQMGGA